MIVRCGLSREYLIGPFILVEHLSNRLLRTFSKGRNSFSGQPKFMAAVLQRFTSFSVNYLNRCCVSRWNGHGSTTPGHRICQALLSPWCIILGHPKFFLCLEKRKTQDEIFRRFVYIDISVRKARDSIRKRRHAFKTRAPLYSLCRSFRIASRLSTCVMSQVFRRNYEPSGIDYVSCRYEFFHLKVGEK
jgi:hypothetical protein